MRWSKLVKISVTIGLILCLQMRCTMSGFGCHLVSEKKLSWLDALVTCQNLGFCLASIEKNVIWQELVNQLKKANIKDDIWTGLNAYEKYAFTYAENNEYIQFLPTRSRLSPRKPCVYLDSNNDYAMSTANCETKKKFICGQTESCNAKKSHVNITAVLNPDNAACALVKIPQLVGNYDGLVFEQRTHKTKHREKAITEERAKSMIKTWKMLQQEGK